MTSTFMGLPRREALALGPLPGRDEAASPQAVAFALRLFQLTAVAFFAPVHRQGPTGVDHAFRQVVVRGPAARYNGVAGPFAQSRAGDFGPRGQVLEG